MKLPARRPRRGQAGFSLVEMTVASLVGMAALTGAFYMYKSQHKHMVIQSGMAEMHMNGEYTLNEIEHYLIHAGLGLPLDMKSLLVSGGGDMAVRVNFSKRGAMGSLHGSSTFTKVVYQIARSDTALFQNMAYVSVQTSSGMREVEIAALAPDPATPGKSRITLVGNKRNFFGTTKLFPMERINLHRCTGKGADTVAGEFRIIKEDPKRRSGLKMDTLTLAEGIESISYRYFMSNGDSLTAMPASLDSLKMIEIAVTAKTLIKDRKYPGDGYRRQNLKAKIGFRRTL